MADTCQNCGGRGVVAPGGVKQPCPRCKGSGEAPPAGKAQRPRVVPPKEQPAPPPMGPALGRRMRERYSDQTGGHLRPPGRPR